MELLLKNEQKLALSQQMLQALKMLQMNAVELEKYLGELCMENPLLENLGTPLSRERPLHFAREWSQRPGVSSLDDPDVQEPVQRYQCFIDSVRAQAGALHIPKLLRRELLWLIGELDSRGFLPEDCGDLSIFGDSRQRYENAVKVLQSLEPAGVGARSLAECLCLQLSRLGVEDELPYTICQKYLPELAKGQFRQICRETGAGLSKVSKAADLIKTLSPKPSNGYHDGTAMPVVFPDVELVESEHSFQVVLADRYLPSYGIDRFYADMAQRETLTEEERTYFKAKLSQAQWVLSCVSRRRDILTRCTQAIAEAQKDFFATGKGELRPLTMTALAETTGVHLSTVSRTVNSKYLSCKWGVYPLSAFFSKELAGTAGGSSKAALNALRALVEAEEPSQPLSDRELSERLCAQGYDISRRTVTKYREQAGIPSTLARRRRTEP